MAAPFTNDQLFGGNQPFNIAGGFDIASLGFQAQNAALQTELQRRALIGSEAESRRGLGAGLLQQLMDVQRDPFSIVPALQAFGAGSGGGGVQAPAVNFAGGGGAGRPAPALFGDLATELIKRLGAFSLSRPVLGGDPNLGTSQTIPQPSLSDVTGGVVG